MVRPVKPPEKESSTPMTLDQLVKKAEELNMMPQTARKVVELVNQESSTAQDLAQVIEKDANITTRLLKISNSAFYGLRREVTTVQHSIVILGYKSVRSLVVASSSKAVHKRFGITEQMMWDHSVGTAIFGRVIAQSFPPSVAELAFVGGLLHNVGKAVMNNECGKAYMEVMKIVYNEKKDFPEAEKDVFGYTYPEVGALVVEKWGLPELITKIIRYHRMSLVDREELKGLLENKELVQGLACVEIAHEICRKLGIGVREPVADINFMDLLSVKALKISEEKLNEFITNGQKMYESEKAIFA